MRKYDLYCLSTPQRIAVFLVIPAGVPVTVKPGTYEWLYSSEEGWWKSLKWDYTNWSQQNVFPWVRLQSKHSTVSTTMFTCLLFSPRVNFLFKSRWGNALLSNKKPESVSFLLWIHHQIIHSSSSSYDYCVTGHVICNLEGVTVMAMGWVKNGVFLEISLRVFLWTRWEVTYCRWSLIVHIKHPLCSTLRKSSATCRATAWRAWTKLLQ